MKTNRSKIRSLILVTITGLLSMTVFTKAHAATDAKVYPGWMCRGQSYDANQFLRYNYDGSIINSNPNQSAIVLCPVVRDVLNLGSPIINYPDLLAVEKVTVNYTNNDSRESVNCRVTTYWERGTQKRSKSNQSSSGVKTSYFHINLGNGGVINHHAKAYYMMTCNLPAKNGPLTSRIHSYSVQETTSVFK